MNSSLDNQSILHAIDKTSMLWDLEKYPEDSLHAIQLAESINLEKYHKKRYTSVAFLGMGGSAIGGQLISDWLLNESKIPIIVNREYELPGFINKDTLVFAVSYSGNTEETLTAFNKACEIGCDIIAITSGGILEKKAIEGSITCIKIPGGRQPRSAIPYQFFIPATILKKLSLISESWNQMDETLHQMQQMRDEYKPETLITKNLAKQLAIKINDTIPFVYGPNYCKGVTYRFKTQLNENSKTPANAGVFPEIFHNSIMGAEGSEHVLEPISFIIIRDPPGEEMISKKIDNFIQIIQEKVKLLVQMETRGTGMLARMFSIIYLGDFVSAYLGILNEHDPGTTFSIDRLKNGF